MSAAGPKPPEIGIQHAIESRRIEVAAAAPTNPEALAAHQLSGEILKAKDQMGAEAAIKEQAARRKEVRYGEGEANDQKQPFGNGEVKYDKKNNKYVGGNAEKRANYEAADRRITAAHSYLTYSEILIESQRTGKDINTTITDMQKNGRLPKDYTPTKYNVMRETALKSLLEIDELRKYSGLSGLSEAQQMDYLEEAFASDPKMREKIAGKLRSVAESAKSLPSTRDPELDQLDIDVKAREALINEQLQQAKDKLGLTDAQRDAIKKSLEVGDNAATIQATLFDELAKARGITHPDIVAKYFPEFDHHEDLRAQLDGLKAIKSPTSAQNQLIAQTTAQLGTSRAKLDGFIANAGVADDTAMQTLRGSYDSVKELVYGKKAPDGKDVGGVTTLFQELESNQKDWKLKDAKLKETKASADPGAETQRLVEESRLIAELDTIFLDATAEVIGERRQKLIELQGKQLEQQEKEANDKGEKEHAAAIAALRKRMDENWIHYDPATRSRQTDRGQIGSDIRTLAYSNEQEGLRRLITRDLVSEGIFVRTVAENQEFTNLKAIVGPRTPEQEARLKFLEKRAQLANGNFEGLTEAETTVLDKVMAGQGDMYKNRLFADYITARGPRAVFQGDILNLKDHEILQLEQKYGGSFEAAIKTSKEGSATLEKLRQKGVRPALAGLLTLILLIGSLGARKDWLNVGS